eukprot:comp4619_c0_seq1/m.816 comp4619_c0_seq1/g.816  ORF comp4619_c0_seq1/g.816 comp4619_c0_seq1/m.816 type:complete len:635 (-) comp4619_c0_seq1:151-2055(-)
MTEAQGCLRDLQATKGQKAIHGQVEDASRAIKAIIEMINIRLKSEIHHARELEMASRIARDTMKMLPNFSMPGLQGVLAQMAEQATTQSNIHKTFAEKLNEEIVPRLEHALETALKKESVILESLRQLQGVLSDQDLALTKTREQANEAYQIIGESDEKIKATLPMARKSPEDIKTVRTIRRAKAKQLHNTYCLAIDAHNAALNSYWMSELPPMMDTLEVVLTTLLSSCKKATEKYVKLATESYGTLPSTYASLTTATAALTPSAEVKGMAQTLIQDCKDVAPYKEPGYRQFEFNSEYGIGLVIDEQTLYPVNETKRALDKKEQAAAKDMDVSLKAAAALKEGGQKMMSEPQLWAVNQSQDMETAELKCAQEIAQARFKHASVRANIDQLSNYGIDGGIKDPHQYEGGLIISGDFCPVCAERAGGARGLGTSAVQCKTCKVIVHESCAPLNWRPCTDSKIESLLADTKSKMAAGPKCPRVFSSSGNESKPVEPDDQSSEPQAPRQVRVGFDYAARNEDELSVTEGSTVVVLHVDSDWATVQADGREGLVPSSYLELGQPAGGDSEVPEDIIAEGQTRVVSFDYKPQEKGEVGAVEGQEVLVLGSPSDGWVEVEVDGIRGFFPASYLGSIAIQTE